MGDDIDFGEGSEFATMSDGFLKAAVQAKRDAGDNSVFFKKNEDGSWSLMQTISPEGDNFGFDSRSDTVDAGRSSPIKFIKAAIKKAKASRYARQKKVGGAWVDKTPQEIVTVNGEPVNLADLVKEGQRMFGIEQNTDFEDGGPSTAQRNGLYQVLAALIEQGNTIKIGNVDISTPGALEGIARQRKQYNKEYSDFKNMQESRCS